ncbi:ligand-binding sensor domain-containing protein [Flexibacter flexilis DSM 6793]|uniref:Ligand-binding sensor domain-containing protein n=1 Tax=Flexibacter flexilis DSM 6793 TaxID=927664 RepID=A0A1I1N0T5_9BACT|nr:two-component regulator propeller domain-containing protein [Flexibacter flexilis]SFC91261.1 ligand-binding sensor domain-containing protein [Flexibacter flexilis DSM 6793]
MRKFSNILFYFLVCLLVLASPRLHAQYNNITFKNISVPQGLSNKNVLCALQDSKGYMWFGTKDGLNRYDGYRFKTYRHNLKDSTGSMGSLSSNHVIALYEDKAGFIWVGTFDGGLCRYDRLTEKFTIYKNNPRDPQSISTNNAYAISADASGNIWVGTFGGGLCKLNPGTGKFKNYVATPSNPNGLSNNSVFAILADKNGILWLGTYGGGLCRFDPAKETFKSYKVASGNRNGISSNDVWDVFEDKNGTLWLGTYGGGLCRFDKNTERFKTYRRDTLNEQSLSSDYVLSVQEDALGKLWVATKGGGLNLFDKQKERFLAYKNDPADINSLPFDDLNKIYSDKSGLMWIATDGKGISRFETRTLQFTTFVSDSKYAAGFTAGAVNAMYEDRNHDLWIGTFSDGLYKYDRNRDQFTSYVVDSMGINNGVSSIAEDASGALWIGTAENGLARLNRSTSRFTYYTQDFANPNSISSNSIETIFKSRNGTMWIGTYGGGLCRFDANSGNFTSYQNNPKNAKTLSSNAVKVIFEAKNGTMWIGTRDAGLCRFNPRTGIFHTYKNNPKAANSLPNNSISAITETHDGSLWVATIGGGIAKLDAKADTFTVYNTAKGLVSNDITGMVEADNMLWISTSNKGLVRFDLNASTFRNFDTDDGLFNNEFIQGAFFKSENKRLYFGGTNGFVQFLPSQVMDNTYMPPVWLTSFVIFNNDTLYRGQKLADMKEIELKAAQNVFNFEFVMLSYLAPERNEYMCMMEGFDKDWVPLNNLRFKSYTNLDAGTYTFRVKAADRDGNWNDVGTSITLVIHPAWYNTWWARLMAVLLVIGISLSYYRNRIKTIERQKAILEQQVAERTAELVEQKKEVELQKDKSDKLLLNILPEATANELKEKGSATPQHYGIASVLFTDFKGFTNLAEKMTPEQLIGELDNCFVAFDDIIVRNNLEKIKTIGDAYMCAGGIPLPNPTNPLNAVMAGLEIQQFMQKTREQKAKQGQSYWELRLGIHTGPIVAGVVGKKKFAYDIWGDTVNTASRMESSGEVGKVNISGDTYVQVNEYFECVYRGKIPAKNKGDIDMYFVTRIKAAYAADANGFEPNEAFKKILNRK